MKPCIAAVSWYQHIVVALNEALCLMAEIVKIIYQHGGWSIE